SSSSLSLSLSLPPPPPPPPPPFLFPPPPPSLFLFLSLSLPLSFSLTLRLYSSLCLFHSPHRLSLSLQWYLNVPRCAISFHQTQTAFEDSSLAMPDSLKESV